MKQSACFTQQKGNLWLLMFLTDISKGFTFFAEMKIKRTHKNYKEDLRSVMFNLILRSLKQHAHNYYLTHWGCSATLFQCAKICS